MTNLVSFDHLNPQLQERVIETKFGKPKAPKGGAKTYAAGDSAPPGARNESARPFEK